MSTPKDGGPAFPMTGMTQRNGQGIQSVFHEGMTLRDYFAGKIIGAMILGQTQVERRLDVPDRIKDCWKIADAMLAAREKSP